MKICFRKINLNTFYVKTNTETTGGRGFAREHLGEHCLELQDRLRGKGIGEMDVGRGIKRGI